MIDESRLETLIDAYFDQNLDEPGRLELEDMLIRSSRARRIFHERTDHHGLLREWALREQGPSVALASAPSARRWIPWVTAGLAACLAVVLSLRWGAEDPTSSPVAGKSDPTADNVALLAELIDVEWAEGSTRYESGAALPKGPLSIAAGLVRLDFYSGAKVYVEGPASLELVSSELAMLKSGRLTAQVPPPAQGFTILSDDMRVVDRGTEFGMSVGDDGDFQVHVFDGEVELHPVTGNAPARSLFGGGAVSFRDGSTFDLPADRGAFANPGAMLAASELARLRGWEEWKLTSEKIRNLPGLLIYYDFRETSRGVTPNIAAAAPPESDGTLVGCEVVPGRWSPKQALGFARTSDRVRFLLEGAARSATMIARVRIDSLPHDHNALLSMAPGEVGEIHWKLDREGRLLLGLRAAPELEFESWERLVSPPIVGERDLGHWLVLATVIDGEAGEMRHYLDGDEVAAASIIRPTPVRLGKANLGNFDTAADFPGTVTRNLNGRIDEFALFERALTPAEIQDFQ